MLEGEFSHCRMPIWIIIILFKIKIRISSGIEINWCEKEVFKINTWETVLKMISDEKVFKRLKCHFYHRDWIVPWFAKDYKQESFECDCIEFLPISHRCDWGYRFIRNMVYAQRFTILIRCEHVYVDVDEYSLARIRRIIDLNMVG